MFLQKLNPQKFVISEMIGQKGKTFNVFDTYNQQYIGRKMSLADFSLFQQQFPQIIHFDIIDKPLGYLQLGKEYFIIRKKYQFNLEEFICATDEFINPVQMKVMVQQIFEKLTQLNRIRPHGNVKPENLLITNDLKLALVDLRPQIEKKSLASIQSDEIKFCGLLMFQLATRKGSQEIASFMSSNNISMNHEKDMMNIGARYGIGFEMFLRSLLIGSHTRNTFDELYQYEYKEYLGNQIGYSHRIFKLGIMNNVKLVQRLSFDLNENLIQRQVNVIEYLLEKSHNTMALDFPPLMTLSRFIDILIKNNVCLSPKDLQHLNAYCFILNSNMIDLGIFDQTKFEQNYSHQYIQTIITTNIDECIKYAIDDIIKLR